MAAAIGRQFDPRLLWTLEEHSDTDAWQRCLDEALAAHLIEAVPGIQLKYQFTHALIQETLLEELPTTELARLHALIGTALEERYGNTANYHAVELAHHFAEAETLLGTDKLVHYSFLAGSRALTEYAWEEALNHFVRGLTAWD